MGYNLRKTHARNGYVLIWCTAAMSMLIGVASLTVDWGLKTLVNGEVQAAADAAAIAGAQRFAELAPTLDDATRLAAVQYAATYEAQSNVTTSGAFNVVAGDVQLGFWNATTRTFASCAVDDANAVRVTVERSVSRGNAIESTIGRAFGVGPLSSKRVSIALVDVPPNYDLFGLDYFTSRGVLTVNANTWSDRGNLASNGDVTLNLLGLVGVSVIDGHIGTLGVTHYPAIAALTAVRDGVVRPAQPYVLPAVDLTVPSTNNNNASLGSLLTGGGDLNVVLTGNIACGTYCVRNLNIAVGALLRVQGPVTIYVSGTVNVLGGVMILSGNAADFKIRVAGYGQVNIAANVLISADIYAPQCSAQIAVGVIYTGRLMAKSVDVNGTSIFILCPDLPPPELGRSRVKLVV